MTRLTANSIKANQKIIAQVIKILRKEKNPAYKLLTGYGGPNNFLQEMYIRAVLVKKNGSYVQDLDMELSFKTEKDI